MTAYRVCVLLLFFAFGISAQPVTKGVPVVECINPLDAERVDAIVSIPLRELKAVPVAFHDGATVIPHQVVGGRALLVLSLGPREAKRLAVDYSGRPPVFTSRTGADLAVKADYILTEGVYTGGRFQSVQSAVTPRGNRSHNAYFKYEGPGWESERVGYRLYLDERSRCDIFGKKAGGIVLPAVGVNDLVSDGKESYQHMLEWGQDIFKVGASLGMGSFAMWRGGRPVFVEVFDSARCRIVASGPIFSEVSLDYYGWRAGGISRPFGARLSIAAGSRMTNVVLAVGSGGGNFCTGLAKHEGCTLIASPASSRGGWGYLALYGKQALTGDDLGTAVFYRLADRVRVTEDSLSQIVVLRPRGGRVEYGFAAAWQQEKDGIRDVEGFRRYLDKAVAELQAPVRVVVRAPKK